MASKLDEITVASEVIYDGKLVKLYRETVRQPDGSEVPREVVRHPGAVALVPLLPDQRVVLVKQFRVAAGQVLLEIPAGTLEPGEHPADTAVRELQEEIGYKPGKIERLVGEYTAPGYTTELIHIYLATDLQRSALDPDSDEFIETVTLPISEALRLVATGEIIDGKTIIGLLWVARRLGV